MELTDKQEAYCQAYVVCANQSAAYRVAYEADSMNVHTVASEACRLHALPHITARIAELQKEAYERNKTTIDELVHTLSNMVRFDVGEMYDEEGNLLPIKKMSITSRQMISDLQVDEIKLKGSVIGHTKKIKVVNKMDVIEKLMKHLGGYEKDNFQKQTKITNSPVINFVETDEDAD